MRARERLRPPLLAVVAAVVCAGFVPPDARADTVHLKNGRTITNVETRVEGDRLIVIQGGSEIGFPMSLVERVDEGPVAASLSRPTPPAPAPQPVADPAADPTSAVPAGENPPPPDPDGPLVEYKVGDRLPKRVRFNTGVDIVRFDLPAGPWVYRGDGTRERATGQEDDPWGHMNPKYIMVDAPGGVLLTLAVTPFLFLADEKLREEEAAEAWLSMARTELREGPMKTVSAARAGQRVVRVKSYYTTTYRHLWEDSDYAQDGIFLLVIPRDFNQQGRFYVLQWFVTYRPDLGKVDLWLDGLDTVVASFHARPIR